ncbi:MAG TPA: hypothetical protein VNA25_14145 [Phycisphaerae bacterium]|nr:hypothetical protein [Phycisphaerae bacterium]
MTEEPTQKQDAAETETILGIRTVTLAGQARNFDIKSIKDTRKFRQRVGELMGSLVEPLYNAYMKAEGDTDKIDTQNLFALLIPLVLGDGVDALLDMLWLYAPELKEFEEGATEDEILDAALEVLEIAFPLVLKIGKRTVGLLSRAGISLT